MEHLVMRLTILKDSATITEEVFDKVLTFLNRLKSQKLLNQSDTITMMVTHIAMALQRQQTKEVVVDLDQEVKQEIDSHNKIQEALTLWDHNLDILESLPENEKYYILANFCNIL